MNILLGIGTFIFLMLLAFVAVILDPKHRENFFGWWNPHKKCDADFEKQGPDISAATITADKIACHSIKESQVVSSYMRQHVMGVQKMDWYARLWARCKVYTPHLEFHLALWPIVVLQTELWNRRYESMQMTWIALCVKLFAERWEFRFRLYAPRDTNYRIR